MRLLPVACLLALAAPLAAQSLTADEIMRRVAENQDRAVEQRARYVYRQRARVRLTKGATKLKREDTRIYQVTPTPDGLVRELVDRDVVHRSGGEALRFHFPGVEDGEDLDGFDRDLADNFHDDLMRDDESLDGVDPDLFPLTSEEQEDYRFELAGELAYRGRDVYRVLYEPLEGLFDGGKMWRGEVSVDREDFSARRGHLRARLEAPRLDADRVRRQRATARLQADVRGDGRRRLVSGQLRRRVPHQAVPLRAAAGADHARQ